MLDHSNQILVQDIRRHLAMTAPRPIALAVTPRAMKRYEAALSELKTERISFIEPNSEPKDGVALTVVVADGPDEARMAYAAMTGAKKAGIPVVFGVPERRIAHAISEQRNVGINYAGMFSLANQYIGTVKPKGSYCEFGVYDGFTFSYAYHALNNKCSHFYAFDSFQGIGGSLKEENTHFKDGEYFANLETFTYNMQFAGADLTRITATKGFFQDTLSNKTPGDYGIQNISIAHIDVDVYEPAFLALDFIAPCLPQGALLLFDDYDQIGASNNLGERKALREWLKKHPEFEVEPHRVYATFGRSFIVHRN